MLKELFERVLKEYKSAHSENFADHPIANILRNEIPDKLEQIVENSDKYKVSGSAGRGNWTYSPWVAVMDRKITETPQKGYYLVYLFQEDMKGVYLSFNQGMTEIKNRYGSNKTKEILRSKASEFREKLGEYPELLDSINLRPINSSSNSLFYEDGNVYAKYYDLSNLPSDDVFIKDLKMFLGLYDSIVDGNVDSNLDEIENNNGNIDFNVYWVSVGKNLQGNYRIGIENGLWAVKEDYANKLENVKAGDYVLFYGNTVGFSLCKVEKEHFFDDSRVWQDDIYPNRIKISKPVYEDAISTEDIRKCLRSSKGDPYISVKAWALAIRGGGGVFRKLKDNEIKCLFKKLNWEFPLKEIEIEFESFTDFLSTKGYYFEPEIIENFLLSLKVKPFIILTGNSGTGKTKIAQLFSEYLALKKGQCHKIIPIGANWTENRHIVGFYNVITKEYMKSDALKLILEARKPENKNKPFFLILDEMNLSHVERYFADFLSAMESKEDISLHFSKRKEKNRAEVVPNSIKIPENLFVIGTVNVDETTYMFSPKVLDRANVIEFSAIPVKNYMLNGLKQEELEGDFEYLENPLYVNNLDLSLRNTRIGDLREYLDNIETEDGKLWDVLSEELNKFQETLKKAGFDFGFRVIDEILRFMYVAWYYEGEQEVWNNWHRYLDSQIKQKMLPKIHGSQRTLENVIKELFELCCNEKSEKAPRVFGDINSNNVKYHSSALKLQEMDKVLYEQRYVAFIN